MTKQPQISVDDEHDYVLIELYIQEQAASQVVPVGCSFPGPHPRAVGTEPGTQRMSENEEKGRSCRAVSLGGVQEETPGLCTYHFHLDRATDPWPTGRSPRNPLGGADFLREQGTWPGGLAWRKGLGPRAETPHFLVS